GLGVGTLTWPFFDAILSLPLLKLIGPLRYLSWVSFAGAAVAAFEADRFAQSSPRARGSTVLLLLSPFLFGLLILSSFFRFRPLHVASGGIASVTSSLVASLGVLTATLVVLFVWHKRARFAAPGTLLLILLAAGELFAQGMRLYRWGSSAKFFPPTPL